MKEVDVKSLKKLGMPLAILVALVAVGFIGFQLLWSQINTLRSELALSRETEVALAAKLQVLNDFEVARGNLFTAILAAIPAENPSIMAISQIRNKSATSGVLVDSIEISRATASDVGTSYVDIGFNVSGSVDNVLGFSQTLSSTAPLGRTEKIDMSASSEGTTAKIIYRVYYSSLPDTIPGIADTLAAFNEDDNNILQKLSTLERAEVTNIEPQAPSLRANPFN